MKASLIGVSLLLVGGCRNADVSFDDTVLETTVSRDTYSDDKFKSTEIFMVDDVYEDNESLETDSYVEGAEDDEAQVYNSDGLVIVGFYNPTFSKEVYSIMEPKSFDSYEKYFDRKDFGRLFNEENVEFFNYEIATCYNYNLQGIVDNSSYLSLVCKFSLYRGIEAVNSNVVIRFDDDVYTQVDKVIKYVNGKSDVIFDDTLCSLDVEEEKYVFENYHNVYFPLNCIFEVDEKITKAEVKLLQDKLNAVTNCEKLLPETEKVSDIKVKYHKK